jgi:hypothetical protein
MTVAEAGALGDAVVEAVHARVAEARRVVWRPRPVGS